MKSSICFFIIVMLISTSCGNGNINYNSPLSVIVKLNSAEEIGDFDEALKYQNIESIYGAAAKSESIEPKKYWRDWVTFSRRLGNDKKFTNSTKYFNYDIREIVNNNKAQVIFKSKNKSASLQEIVYDLDRTNDSWIIEKIDYKKQ